MNVCVRAVCRPESRPSTNGELAEIASSSGSTGRSRSHTRTARSAPRTPTWTCSENVLLRQRDVLQPLLHAAVVLGVDDALLAVVGPRVRAGRPERDAVLGGEREQAAAVVALGGERRRRGPRRGRSGSRSRRRSARPRSTAASTGSAAPRRRAAARSAARGRASPGRGSRTPPRARPCRRPRPRTLVACGRGSMRHGPAAHVR